MEKKLFARLISHITQLCGHSMDQYEIEAIESLTTPVVAPTTSTYYSQVTAEKLDDMLRAIRDGHKIEAIKAYRTMSGIGLKESKDAIEKYWYGPDNW